MGVRTVVPDPYDNVYIIENSSIDNEWSKWAYAVFWDEYKTLILCEGDTNHRLPNWITVA